MTKDIPVPEPTGQCDDAHSLASIRLLYALVQFPAPLQRDTLGLRPREVCENLISIHFSSRP